MIKDRSKKENIRLIKITENHEDLVVDIIPPINETSGSPFRV